MNFLPFALPDISDEEIEEVVDTLKSGWLSTGPKTKIFEKNFAEFLGSGVEAISVNSATAGLHLALEAIDLQPGQEVITSPNTFTATAEVVRYFGAHPKLVDICPDTLNIDTSKIEEAITDMSTAIIPVHFSGLSCDMDPILEISKEKKLKVVEDAAHSFPTDYKDKIIGTLDSDATVFSFYATKTLTTGEGGMIVTKNKQIAERCKVMRLHGINRDAFDRYNSKRPSWFYEVVAPGFKYNLTDVAAALGIQQLKKAERFLERRQKIARYYSEVFADLPITLPKLSTSYSHSACHLYVIQLIDSVKLNRDDFIMRMSEKGIGCSVHFIPLHLHPYWRDTYGLEPNDFPNAYNYYQKAVSLPIYTKMSDSDVERVAEAVKALLS